MSESGKDAGFVLILIGVLALIFSIAIYYGYYASSALGGFTAGSIGVLGVLSLVAGIVVRWHWGEGW